MGGAETFVQYLDTFGVLGLLIVLGLGFYTKKLRLGSDYDRCETENAELRAEVKVLWAEKVEDAKESQDLARAYLKVREADKS